MELDHRSDHELLADVTKLIGSHRELTAKLIAHLAEIEERRLHLVAGFSSMFEFCTKKLGLGDGEAFRRILAARLFRRFPIVFDLLVSGKVNLSALELSREHLTNENHVELLEAVSGKSKHEVAALLATRFPKPDVPSRIRKLPARPAPRIDLEAREPLIADSASRAPGFTLEPSLNDHAHERAGDRSRARIEQLSEARFKVEFTASAELREKLELCRDLMGHANPSRDIAVVVERAVELLLEDLARKRLGRTKRPRRTPPAGTPARTFASIASKSSRARANASRITNAARRDVYERDGLRCTYVSPDGRRCEARAFLELDHAKPRGMGGGDGPDNLRVLCRGHNQFAAEQAFGREHVEHSRQHRRHRRHRQHRQHRQQKSDRMDGRASSLSVLGVAAPDRTSPTGAENRQTKAGGSSGCENRVLAHSLGVFEKVRVALVSMGFASAQARQAVAEIEKMHTGTGSLTAAQALREALLVATAGLPGIVRLAG